ncbi:3-ketoacyl-CoA thiolase A [Thecamonas trahens ATCC 50062]|uniref:acetyl-CoA C-acyltransferase n=1 Tax=Thecamonas trahens ATCC 50062 TaxID=461836 RepID=A0A0L0DMZ9_THETB|nr:3-ketoacyl-CoA thiolase A [Thecamonas trahens ATCC 50062]KNC53630.1 3-ketoacyl-CoA thiolase A [Thecamonas trahens ATCC 50062]|eukprot:XP_013761947.1 3-ketoacyl-CoA thiolase A [Thecamonas trahens ATCC 50062]
MSAPSSTTHTPSAPRKRTARLLAQVAPAGGRGRAAGGDGDDDVVVLAAVRTPIGRARKGSFRDTHPTTLLQAAVTGAVEAAGVPRADVGDVVVGNVLAPGGFATQARMALFLADFPVEVPVVTTNRQCSSGLQAVASVAAAIATGVIDVGIGAGVESMSSADMMASLGPVNDAVHDVPNAAACLTPMGITSENVAAKYGVSRETQDAFALLSHQRALAAQDQGLFDDEIVPVTAVVVDENDDETQVIVRSDDGPRPSTLAKLAKLRPAFKKGGSTTAGNSSQVSDGAAAVVLASRAYAKTHGSPVLGRFVAFAVAGVPPAIMGIGPAVAIPAVLAKAGLSIDDIDIFEINEAFASQATYCVDVLGIPTEKVNPLGGAIALGHPLGCTGARQVATLLHHLARTGGRYGVVSMCIGGGQGAAAIFEREP